MSKVAIELKDVTKSFDGNQILKGISGEIDEGQVLAIIGPSGSGKSTLLRAVNQLAGPTSGSVVFEGQDLTKVGKQSLNHLGEKIGMVFQSFNLFPNHTVLENVTLGPRRVKKLSEEQANQEAMHYLKQVGMAEKANAYPESLSGGQKQRVAIARALAMKPKVLFFDEPTSALDPENVGEVLKVIQQLAEEKRTMVIVTHEMNFARQVADKVWLMADGQIVEENDSKTLFTAPKEAITKRFIEQVSLV
ncbi:amino acid ABC transporter ATP-binding protein [Fructobacillus parabroussonetiae]|uniref:Amino acid ABC transporter ATP-binding protein n=1 Tax=Fructobacillus parabroussonetiae TaxID=2713174 RepID=A0ABS5QXS0_9LACO|nr:amino acid ABC transporter ATP-binding protein [Fructobacillus parabroussonetiae]MBS9337079.1 amino acid ABC transporter ATP-binding protein [Fructobacillus parabroussonetiae]